MAEEIRMVFVEGAAGAGAAPGAVGGGSAVASPRIPIRQPVPGTGTVEFDPVAAARKQMEAAKQVKEVEAARLLIDPEYRAKKEGEAAEKQKRLMDEMLAARKAKAREILSIARDVAITMDGSVPGVSQAITATGGISAGASLAAAGPVGVAVGAALAVVSVAKAAGDTMKELIQKFDSMATQLAPFSGQLSLAQAMAQVRQVQGDIRRAGVIGPELSEFIQAKSELSQTFQDLMVTVGKEVLPFVVAILQDMKIVLDHVLNGINIVKGSVEGTGASMLQLVAILSPAAGALAGMHQALRRIARNGDADLKVVGREFFPEIENFKEFSPQRMGIPPQQVRLDIGAFGGLE